MSSRRHDAGSAGKGAFTSGYTAHDVAALLGLSVGQIRAYIRAGFLARRRGTRGEHRLSLQDLVLLRTAKELSERVPPGKVRRAAGAPAVAAPHPGEREACQRRAPPNRLRWAAVAGDSLERVARDVIACERCPRLRAWCREVARLRVKRFRDQEYWGRPLPGFGDPGARLLIVGLAPAAHGGNRTGRIFTGDRSGDFLFAALHRAGFASRPTSVSRDDGLRLTDCYIAPVVRCAPPANKPTPEEIRNCREYLTREWALLTRVRAVLALGKVAMDGFLAMLREAGRVPPRKAFAFGHGARHDLGGGLRLFASYHPSQQNTFTGKLTPRRFDAVLDAVKDHLRRPRPRRRR